MAIYTFYLRTEKGTSPAFETVELDGEMDVKAVINRVLAEHPGSTRVEVWREDRLLLHAERDGTERHFYS